MRVPEQQSKLNWWQVLSALVLLIGYIVVIANAVKQNSDLVKTVKKLEEGFQAHINAQGLHRGPDFELRMLNMERELEKASSLLGNIQSDVRALLTTSKNRSEIMFDLSAVAPYLGASGNALVNLDENKTGADDFSGELLIYAADVIAAVSEGEDIPSFPEALTSGINDRITGAAKVSLILASSILPIAQFQVSGKARTALKYINQVIRNLLANQTIPPVPSSIRETLS